MTEIRNFQTKPEPPAQSNAQTVSDDANWRAVVLEILRDYPEAYAALTKALRERLGYEPS